MTQYRCSGGCHCGAVRFEVKLPERVEVRRCNCSICQLTGYLHLTVSRENFELVSGQDQLTEYRFNTRTARHLFCSVCGIKSFYVPRSHPDGFSINLKCVALAPEIQVDLGEFDGRNWEANVDSIRHLGQ